MMQRKYRAAAVSFEPAHADKTGNIARLSDLARQAAARGAKLIVMPEMATIGLFWDSREQIAPCVETIPGATSDHFAALARDFGVYVAVGMGEVDPVTGHFYNAAILVGPDGLVGKHRKVHVYLSDPLWAADGDLGFQVWDTPLGRLGMMICMDANYPEAGRLLALQDADALLLLANWVDEPCPAPLWITRAFDNGISAICSNRWGEARGFRFSGGAAVLAPDGSVQAYHAAPSDGLAFGEIDLDDPRRRGFPFDRAVAPLAGRRPELYHALPLNRYAWKAEHMHAHFGAALPAGAKFRALAWEFEAPLPSVAERLEQFERRPAAGRGEGPDLIVLPELSFSGPPADMAAARSLAEPSDGPFVESLINWCAQSGCYLVAGFIESDVDRLYNTVALVGPEGLCAHYRKTHLGTADTGWATPGDQFVWADTPLGRIGLLAGTDLLYPEPARCLALEGVDVVCVPAALAGPQPISLPDADGVQDGEHWNLFRTRAAENDVYLVVANWHGNVGGVQCMGQGGIFFGPVLFEADAREARMKPWDGAGGPAIMSIDTRGGNNPVRAKPAMRRRRPAVYRTLSAGKRALP